MMNMMGIPVGFDSTEVPNEPVVSTKSGLLFEWQLIERYIEAPHTGRGGGEIHQPLHRCMWHTPTASCACHPRDGLVLDDVCKNLVRRSILGWVNRLARMVAIL